MKGVDWYLPWQKRNSPPPPLKGCCSSPYALFFSLLLATSYWHSERKGMNQLAMSGRVINNDSMWKYMPWRKCWHISVAFIPCIDKISVPWSAISTGESRRRPGFRPQRQYAPDRSPGARPKSPPLEHNPYKHPRRYKIAASPVKIPKTCKIFGYDL